MNRLFRSLLATTSLAVVTAHAADPVFKPTIVTASRAYEKQTSSFSVGGMSAGATTTSVSRVTVVLDGLLITGEWEPKTLRSATAKDFRRGTDVLAAIDRGRLLLKHSDGSIVTAKIVDREKQRKAAAESD